jgi:hypothetical protein
MVSLVGSLQVAPSGADMFRREYGRHNLRGFSMGNLLIVAMKRTIKIR